MNQNLVTITAPPCSEASSEWTEPRPTTPASLPASLPSSAVVHRGEKNDASMYLFSYVYSFIRIPEPPLSALTRSARGASISLSSFDALRCGILVPWP